MGANGVSFRNLQVRDMGGEPGGVKKGWDGFGRDGDWRLLTLIAIGW